MSTLLSISSDILRAILLRISLCDSFSLSVASFLHNQAVAQALDAYIPAGRQWWEDKIVHDFPREDISDLADMMPNDQYIFLFAYPTAKLYYAVLQDRPSILQHAMLTLLENREGYDYLSMEDLAYVLSLRNLPDVKETSLLDTAVWEALQRDQIFPLKEMISLGRPDLALRLLQYPRVTAQQLFESAYQVIRAYVSENSPLTLEVLRRILQHPKFVISTDNYYTLTEAVRSGRPEVVSAVLEAMREDSAAGRKTGVDTVKGYPLYTAAEKGQSQIVALLLAAGANPSVGQNRPFRNALRGKHFEVMRLLAESHHFELAEIRSSDVNYLPRSGKELIKRLQAEGKVTVR